MLDCSPRLSLFTAIPEAELPHSSILFGNWAVNFQSEARNLSGLLEGIQNALSCQETECPLPRLTHPLSFYAACVGSFNLISDKTSLSYIKYLPCPHYYAEMNKMYIYQILTPGTTKKVSIKFQNNLQGAVQPWFENHHFNGGLMVTGCFPNHLR